MKLTKRQTEMIKLVKMGLKNEEIANRLGVKIATVNSTLCAAYIRLGGLIERPKN